MSERTDSESTPSATEPPGLALDREKWVAEKEFRERELNQNEREQRRLEDELRFRMEESRRSRWSSPLVLAVLAASVAALGNAGVAWQNARDQRRLEDARAVAAQKALEFNSNAQLIVEGFKAEAARLLEAVKTNDPDKAAVNLQFLLDVGLVSNENTKSGLITYLKNRTPGEGAALPASTGLISKEFSPIFHFDRNIVNMPPDITRPQDEIAFMVRYIHNGISLHGETIATALSDYTIGGVGNIVALMRQHSNQNVTKDTKIDFNNREFMRSLLWSIAKIATLSDIPEAVLDAGIDQAAKMQTP